MTDKKAAVPDFLLVMLQDFPGNDYQKDQAYKAAMSFIQKHGAPPYAAASTALDFFSAMMRAAGK